MSDIQSIPLKTLKSFLQRLFASAGLPDSDVLRVTEILTLQEMRGVRTHGLRHVDFMLTPVLQGLMNHKPLRKVIRDEDAIVVVDGDHGIGVLACMDAMDHAIRKARDHGIGIGIAIHNNHFLSAAPYCLRAAEQDMIGIACSNSDANMGYPGAKGQVIGNGPIGFAAPTAEEYPIVFDAALSTSIGKLRQWTREGLSIPPEFTAVDATGQPTTDPGKVLEGGAAMPIGGHKGAGLLLLIELLTGVLGGGAFLSSILKSAERESKLQGESQCCIAIDIKHFMAVDSFRSRTSEFIADMKSKPLAEGHDVILMPGERAARSIKEREQHGIPIEADVKAKLIQLATQQGIEHPFSESTS